MSGEGDEVEEADEASEGDSPEMEEVDDAGGGDSPRSAIARTPDVQPPPQRALRPIPEAWLSEIEARILRAEAPADFVDGLAKSWGRHPRNVWRYVAKVRDRLRERAKSHDPDADREQIRSLLLRAYRTAEAGTEKGPDAKGMVAAAKALADVTGATAAQKVDITSGGSPLQIYAPAEREP